MKTIALSSIALAADDTHSRSRGLIRGQIVERRRSYADTHDVRWFRRTANGTWVTIASPWTASVIITVDGLEVFS